MIVQIEEFNRDVFHLIFMASENVSYNAYAASDLSVRRQLGQDPIYLQYLVILRMGNKEPDVNAQDDLGLHCQHMV